jgi:hypothetical protein
MMAKLCASSLGMHVLSHCFESYALIVSVVRAQILYTSVGQLSPASTSPAAAKAGVPPISHLHRHYLQPVLRQRLSPSRELPCCKSPETLFFPRPGQVVALTATALSSYGRGCLNPVMAVQ